jgi:hypothetical protein
MMAQSSNTNAQSLETQLRRRFAERVADAQARTVARVACTRAVAAAMHAVDHRAAVDVMRTARPANTDRLSGLCAQGTHVIRCAACARGAGAGFAQAIRLRDAAGLIGCAVGCGLTGAHAGVGRRITGLGCRAAVRTTAGGADSAGEAAYARSRRVAVGRARARAAAHPELAIACLLRRAGRTFTPSARDAYTRRLGCCHLARFVCEAIRRTHALRKTEIQAFDAGRSGGAGLVGDTANFIGADAPAAVQVGSTVAHARRFLVDAPQHVVVIVLGAKHALLPSPTVAGARARLTADARNDARHRVARVADLAAWAAAGVA